MSTNNKWGALSMRDRAFLIREAVRNGITDIDSIRNTWEHRFDGLQDVGEKVNTPKEVELKDIIHKSLDPLEDAVTEYLNWMPMVENAQKKGYDAEKDIWVPHESAEKGSKTVEYGIKLSEHPKIQKIIDEKGYITAKEAREYREQYIRQIAKQTMRLFTSATFPTAWYDLHPKLQMILIDKAYQTGTIAKWPKLMQAMYTGDWANMYKESKSFYKDNTTNEWKETLDRNNKIHDVIKFLESNPAIKINDSTRGMFYTFDPNVPLGKEEGYSINTNHPVYVEFSQKHKFGGDHSNLLLPIIKANTAKHKYSGETNQVDTTSSLYHYPLDPEDTLTSTELVPTVPKLALNPETWGINRIQRKARRMAKGKDLTDIRSYDPTTNSANAQLVHWYNVYNNKKEREKVKGTRKVNSDYSFWDAVKTFALSNGAMDHPHPTPQLYDPLTQQQVLRSGDKEAISNMWAQQYAFEKDQLKPKLIATKTGLMIPLAAVNPYGLIGDLGLTLADATSTAAIDGDFSNYGTDLATSAALDVAAGPLSRGVKAVRQAMKPLPKTVTGIRTADDAIRFGAQAYQTHINPNVNVDDLVSRTSLINSGSLDGALGEYSTSTGRVLINREQTLPGMATTSVHEYRHADDIGIHSQYDDQYFRPFELDENMNITPDRSNPTLSRNAEEIKQLQKAYPINKLIYPKADDLAEAVAINAGNIAYAQQLYIKTYNKLPSKQELQDFISLLNAEQLAVVRQAGGGYGAPEDLVRQYVTPWRMKNAMLNIK